VSDDLAGFLAKMSFSIPFEFTEFLGRGLEFGEGVSLAFFVGARPYFCRNKLTASSEAIRAIFGCFGLFCGVVDGMWP